MVVLKQDNRRQNPVRPNHYRGVEATVQRVRQRRSPVHWSATVAVVLRLTSSATFQQRR
jgi:hypothetical protein